MASDNEACCESDPNFAVICGFLEKFGITCGLTNINFLHLQYMLENNQEVSQELVDLHIKLLRKARKSVSLERWERAIIKLCHGFCSQDAWEIERFGYKKARLSSKLRILKELLEMQFDYNLKFKNEVNKLSADELRTRPLGKDCNGHLYWFQADETCQIRVYKEDADEETWSVVAKDRESLVGLINQLGDRKETLISEDSNSLESEKPVVDTGQDDSNMNYKSEQANSELNTEGDQTDQKEKENIRVTANPELNTEKDQMDQKEEDGANSELNSEEDQTDQKEEEEEGIKLVQVENELINKEVIKSGEIKLKNKIISTSTVTDKISEMDKLDETDKNTNLENINQQEDIKVSGGTEERDIILPLNKSGMNMRIKPIIELIHPDVNRKLEITGVKEKYIRSDSSSSNMHHRKAVESAGFDVHVNDLKRPVEEEDDVDEPSYTKRPRTDRPTLLGNKKKKSYSEEEDEISDEIEEPLMLVTGEGSGHNNRCGNQSILSKLPSPIVGEVIEESVMYVYGLGFGRDCETGNEDGSIKEQVDSAERTPTDETNTRGSITNNPSTSNDHRNNLNKIEVKLGTIIDVRTNNSIPSIRDPNKKSRWDIRESDKLIHIESQEETSRLVFNDIESSKTSELPQLLEGSRETRLLKQGFDNSNKQNRSDVVTDETRTTNNSTEECDTSLETPKKSMFFFGPGCLQYKPIISPSKSVVCDENKESLEENLEINKLQEPSLSLEKPNELKVEHQANILKTSIDKIISKTTDEQTMTAQTLVANCVILHSSLDRDINIQDNNKKNKHIVSEDCRDSEVVSVKPTIGVNLNTVIDSTNNDSKCISSNSLKDSKGLTKLHEESSFGCNSKNQNKINSLSIDNILNNQNVPNSKSELEIINDSNQNKKLINVPDVDSLTRIKSQINSKSVNQLVDETTETVQTESVDKTDHLDLSIKSEVTSFLKSNTSNSVVKFDIAIKEDKEIEASENISTIIDKEDSVLTKRLECVLNTDDLTLKDKSNTTSLELSEEFSSNEKSTTELVNISSNSSCKDRLTDTESESLMSSIKKGSLDQFSSEKQFPDKNIINNIAISIDSSAEQKAEIEKKVCDSSKLIANLSTSTVVNQLEKTNADKVCYKKDKLINTAEKSNFDDFPHEIKTEASVVKNQETDNIDANHDSFLLESQHKTTEIVEPHNVKETEATTSNSICDQLIADCDSTLIKTLPKNEKVVLSLEKHTNDNTHNIRELKLVSSNSSFVAKMQTNEETSHIRVDNVVDCADGTNSSELNISPIFGSDNAKKKIKLRSATKAEAKTIKKHERSKTPSIITLKKENLKEMPTPVVLLDTILMDKNYEPKVKNKLVKSSKEVGNLSTKVENKTGETKKVNAVAHSGKKLNKDKSLSKRKMEATNVAKRVTRRNTRSSKDEKCELLIETSIEDNSNATTHKHKKLVGNKKEGKDESNSVDVCEKIPHIVLNDDSESLQKQGRIIKKSKNKISNKVESDTETKEIVNKYDTAKHEKNVTMTRFKSKQNMKSELEKDLKTTIDDTEKHENNVTKTRHHSKEHIKSEIAKGTTTIDDAEKLENNLTKTRLQSKQILKSETEKSSNITIDDIEKHENNLAKTRLKFKQNLQSEIERDSKIDEADIEKQILQNEVQPTKKMKLSDSTEVADKNKRNTIENNKEVEGCSENDKKDTQRVRRSLRSKLNNNVDLEKNVSQIESKKAESEKQENSEPTELIPVNEPKCIERKISLLTSDTSDVEDEVQTNVLVNDSIAEGTQQNVDDIVYVSTFKLDDEDNSAVRITRKRAAQQSVDALREVRIHDKKNQLEKKTEVDNKRQKLKRRSIDSNLRRSIEEKKLKEASSSEEGDYVVNEDKTSNQDRSKKTGCISKRRVSTHSFVGADSPAVSSDAQSEASHIDAPVVVQKKPRKQKKTLLGLEISEETGNVMVDGPIIGVRQSRRIAQIKIKEEAERRKLEEVALHELKEEQRKRKGKKNEDKDYIAEKKKRNKNAATEDETTGDAESEEKKKRKRKRKHWKPTKQFDIFKAWKSSSSSSSSEIEDEEEEIEEDDHPLVLKSDHEFSPESELEEDDEVQPLKRARTARKEESDAEVEVDDCACQKCGQKDHPEWILLCDSCDSGWHCSCLRPALLVIPEGDWFCPPCQHITLVKNLEAQLIDYDKKLNKREMETRRKERLAYIGISLDNVLPSKESDENRSKHRHRHRNKDADKHTEDSEGDDNDYDDEDGDNEENDESNSDDSNSDSETSSTSESDSEPVYQLRERRQAHSYRFNDYDDLINSAIQDELDAVKGAGNLGRGKDIATIVNVEREEAQDLSLKGENGINYTESEVCQDDGAVAVKCAVEPVSSETLPPVVPKDYDSKHEEHDSDEEIIRPVRKIIGKKKHRKLNSLDVSSGDDPDSDEDFKGSSTSESEEDFEEDGEYSGSYSSDDSRRGKRRKGFGPIRRSTRARISRYDRDFINDDTDSEGTAALRRKKTKSLWDETESEESDRSWGKRKRKAAKSKKKISSSGKEKKLKKKKKKKAGDDSDPEVFKKRPNIKFGGLHDDEEIGRRTRGKKINYLEALGTDSEEEMKRKPPRSEESEEEYNVHEDEEFQNHLQNEGGSDESGVENVFKDIAAMPKVKPRGRGKAGLKIPRKPKDAPLPEFPSLMSEISQPTANISPSMVDHSILQPMGAVPHLSAEPRMLNPSLIQDSDLLDIDEELDPIEQINKNVEQMNEQEMEKMMEEEDYANKQLQLIALQIEKEKRRKEREAKRLELMMEQTEQKTPKKRGRKPKTPMMNAGVDVIPQQSSFVMNEPSILMNSVLGNNAELSEPPLPMFSEIVPILNADGTPKKRRGRGKGKKTLAAEAAALAAAGGNKDSEIDLHPDGSTSGSNTISPTTDLSIHGSKLGIAAPPQPFSQSQPAPSVITRMLQPQPGQANFAGSKYFSGASGDPSLGPQQPYLSGAGGPRSSMSTSYQQPTPGLPHYPVVRNNPANSHQLHSAGSPVMYHAHRTMDPSPSGGGPIAVSTANRDGHSPGVSIIPPTSPLNKGDPTPPPPPYTRPQISHFPPGAATTAAGSRHVGLVPSHLQHRPSNMSPYHSGVPPNYYGSYPPPQTINTEEEQSLPIYPSPAYSEAYPNENPPAVQPTEGNTSTKTFDEETGGEFVGLVSYFSSQREDDLDT